MYYKKSDYSFIQFQKSKKKDKMYDAVIQKKPSGKISYVSFGYNKMGNYHDKTGLNLYPNLIHGDKKRRKAFRSRMKGFLRDGYYSPAFFSYYYLW